MKGIYIASFFFLYSLISIAQIQPSVNWGSDYKFEKRTRIAGMLSDSLSVFVYKENTSKKQGVPDLIIERFSQSNMNLNHRMEIFEWKMKAVSSSGVSFSDLMVIDNRLWIFFEGYIKRGRNGRLYAAEIFMEKDSVGELKLIDELDMNRGGEFTLVESYNGKSLLVLHNHPFEKYANEKFSYKVLNPSMDLIWSRELELPYKERSFKVSHHLIDQNGNVHMITALNYERNKGENNSNSFVNHSYNLLSFYPNENRLKEFEISLGEKYISALTFDMGPDGSLVIAGFYSNSASYSIAGTFYLRMDPITRRVVQSNLKPFEKSFMMEFIPEKKIKKGKELSDFYFDHLIVQQDGSAILVAEQYYMQISYNYNDPYMYGGFYGPTYGPWGYSPYNRSNYNYQYYYNDIIIVRVSKDGEIEWARKIPKRQMSSNDGGYYSSYAIASNESGVYLLFNDNPRNTPALRKSGEEPYIMTRPSKSVAVFVAFSNDGQVHYAPLFAQKDVQMVLRPKLHFQSSPDHLVIFSQKGSMYKFGSITIPK